MYIILIFILLLFLILHCVKKTSNIETFKVIYNTIDNCSKNNIAGAINDIYNRTQNLKQKLNKLNKHKYKKMYEWYLSETYTARNLNNRKLILVNSNINTKNMSASERNKTQHKEAIKNIKSANKTNKEFDKLRAEDNKPKSETDQMMHSATDTMLDAQTQNKKLSELIEEWIDSKGNLLLKDEDKYKDRLNDIEAMSFDGKWQKERKQWKLKCKQVHNKNSKSCIKGFAEYTEKELGKLREKYQEMVREDAKKEALVIFQLRNIKDPKILKSEIKLMKKKVIGDVMGDVSGRYR
jgi:hypothetical protein